MFEFDKYDEKKSGTRSRPSVEYTPFKGYRRRALLLWGEHCVECAAPDCFASCDLYEARPDERCRRFAYGIFRNRSYPSGMGCGAEVIFRRWGKIEARGNLVMLPAWVVKASETLLQGSFPIFNGLGRLVRRLGGDIRWSYLTFALMERLNRAIESRLRATVQPDAFIVEVYNPNDVITPISLGVGIDLKRCKRSLRHDQVPRPFQRRIQLNPGYNRILIPFVEMGEVVAAGLPFNLSLLPEEENGAHLVFLSLDFFTYLDNASRATDAVAELAPSRKTRPAAKCVIFDLDNTIWDGVLVEGKVSLRPRIRDLFEELDRRGILISVASKNNHDDGMAKLKEFGLDEYVLYPKISWNQKSKALKQLATDLDIGSNTFVFVDDSPVERNEVSRALPEVEVLSDEQIASLLDHPRLAGSKTSEAKSRRAMYRTAMVRDAARVSFGDDYIQFLRDCGLIVEIMPVTPEHLDRVVELVQRTNQLNFSGRKYSREEITQVIESEEFQKHVISVKDKFGPYGVVGFALTRVMSDRVRVEDFMLSCRVQGRFIEQVLFDHVARTMTRAEFLFEVNFKKTDRNQLAQGVLEKLGFDLSESVCRPKMISPDSFKVDFVTVIDKSPAVTP